MDKTQFFYITTPIYYVNDSPHVGHAYTTIAADAMARFMRLDGVRVHFLTGTDEHGLKVDKAARGAGIDPKVFTNEVSKRFRNLVHTGKNILGVTNDDFIRTTEDRHIKAAQALWQQMEKEGHIYLSKYEGWYSVRDEAYYQESELVDGKAPTGAEVEWVEEPSYFFDLSKWAAPLQEFYRKNPAFVTPESRYNEVISFVRGGLKDLSVSRTGFRWGIPIPGNPQHVMYVWVDALANYLTAIGYPDTNSETYQYYWKNSDESPVHIVGKDIIRFHAVYWPAFLMAAKLPLPKRIIAHGWWTIEGQKMSKSLGNVIAPEKLIEDYGLDQLRYFLLREVPFGNDGNFSRASLVTRVNSELANNIGNLVQRTLALIHKHCEGKIPQYGIFEKEDERLLHSAMLPLSLMRAILKSKYDFSRALEQIVELANFANIYIDQQQPWALKAKDPIRMNTVLYTLAETIRHIAILLLPFVPGAANNMLDQLGVPANERDFSAIPEIPLERTQGAKAVELSPKALVPLNPMPKPSAIFPRIESEKV